MTAPPAVTLCIINHNGAEHLREAFRAVEAQDWPFAEILLIDNASDDSSLEVARVMCPKASLISLPRNLGPGAARNAGFRSAANDLILFQDNDVCLCKNTLDQLIKHLKNHWDALLVTPRVLYKHDPDTVQYDSADCHFLGLMATRNADTRAQDLDVIPRETTSMVSSCFLINRERWNEENLFDETFGFNLEDHDFGVRSRLAGHSLWVDPRALVEHGSGTPGLSYRPGQAASEQRLFYLTLNRWTVISKCYATKTVAILFPALLLYEVMQFAWLVSHGHFRIWSRAVRAYWQSRKRIRAKRQAIQSKRRVADRNVLQDVPLPLTRAVRDGAITQSIVGMADYLMRSYWRLVRRWV